MTNKLQILLECLPEAPFKEQLKQAIQEEISNKLLFIQGKFNLADSIYKQNAEQLQGILEKLREILQCKEGESITKVAEQVMRYPNWFGNWIVQYDEELFVAFDPTTDGANIAGAFRSFSEAENYLQRYMEVV